MSERVSLGETDADARWMGVRRHQVLLVPGGLVLVAAWVVGVHVAPIGAALGVGLLVGAVPVLDDLTVAEWAVTATTYLARGRLTRVDHATDGSTETVSARGVGCFTGYELDHRGRRDLSGADVDGAERLGALVDALATRARPTHVSVHVRTSSGGSWTVLGLPVGQTPPAGWTAAADLAGRACLLAPGESDTWLLERWRYVRHGERVATVARVRDFSAAPEGGARLAGLLGIDDVLVALHLEVVPGARARRLTARAVHRADVDGAVGRGAGFRRSARSVRGVRRQAQAEALVAEGRALVRLAVYVVVDAASLGELRIRRGVVRDALRDAGLRADLGAGRQAPWLCRSLPGGPGW